MVIKAWASLRSSVMTSISPWSTCRAHRRRVASQSLMTSASKSLAEDHRPSLTASSTLSRAASRRWAAWVCSWIIHQLNPTPRAASVQRPRRIQAPPPILRLMAATRLRCPGLAEEVALGVEAGVEDLVGAGESPLVELVHNPLLVQVQALQVLVVQLPVDDEGCGQPLIGGGDAHIGGGQGALLRLGDHAQLAVSFQNGKLHVVDEGVSG